MRSARSSRRRRPRWTAPTPEPGLTPAPELTSTRNPRVRDAAALLRRRDRDAQGRYLIEGPRYVSDLLGAHHPDVDEVLAEVEHAAELAPRAEAAGVRLTTVTPEIIARVTDSETPQGVVAIARQRRRSLADLVGEGVLVVLDRVSDPGNAGAIVRTSVAAGARGIVFTSGSVDPWNPKAVRASAGAVVRARLVVDVTLEDVAAACSAAGQRIVALDTGGGTDIVADGVLRAPVALLLGSEAHGLRPGALELADEVAAIPLYGPVESLNLGAAAAVAIFAAARDARGGDG